MGSLFHMVAREDALELGLLAAMGYDAVSPGNHELDLMPDGLARILSAARRGGLVQRYRVLERGGVRFGLQRR
jgi:2',3'-cyclic-nucleotide 2'-phosphodiesterase (5'-nucleotidase family)